MRVWMVIVGGLIGLAACRVEGTAPVDSVAPSCLLAEARVSPAAATLRPGDTLRATAEFKPCGSQQVRTDFRFVSGDTTVARVDSISGLITARHAGVTTIRGVWVADRNLSGAMALRVDP